MRSNQPRGLNTGLAAALLMSGLGCTEAPAPPKSAVKAVGEPTDGSDRKAAALLGAENGLSSEDRKLFYHLPEGSELYPLSFFRALLDQETGKPFAEDLERFGFITDEAGAGNPYGLPVGMSVATPKDTKIEMIGINCAGCHVGQIIVDGAPYRLDGAPNFFDIQRFYIELAVNTVKTASHPGTVWRFLKRYRVEVDKDPNKTYSVVLKQGTHELLQHFEGHEHLDRHGEAEAHIGDLLEKAVEHGARDEKKLKATLELAAKIHGKPHGPSSPLKEKSKESIVSMVQHAVHDFASAADLLRDRGGNLKNLGRIPGGVESGYGRVDAFGVARDLLFSDHQLPNTAPISYPSIWGFGRFAWLHITGNTNSVLMRNIGEALGVGGVVDSKTYDSTVILDNLNALEVLARKLTPPAWPAKLLGPIDPARTSRGEKHFKQHCETCHGAGTELENGLVEFPMFTLREIQTDPAAALNFDRKVGDVPYYKALGDLLMKVRDKLFEEKQVSAEDRAKMEYQRQNVVFRSPVGEPSNKAYVARELKGIWASAPYLHNGSVPTLYHLLLPPDQRPKTFTLGDRNFDREKVGYKHDGKGARLFTFDTAPEGNLNTGHQYGTNLADEERMDLVEYLKTL